MEFLRTPTPRNSRHAIAVVGLGCWYPGARDPRQFWENILSRRLEFRRIPDCRLPLDDYCDPSGEDADKIYAQRAALIDGFEFDWINRRIPKSMFESTDLVHWLSVEVAEQAIHDAGYAKGSLDRQGTGVIVGNTLTGDITRAETVRLRWPVIRRALHKTCEAHGLSGESIAKLEASMEKTFKSVFSEPNADTLAGGLANTIAGRVCNYFDLHGGGYIVDGACSSSLLAVYTAAQALSSGDLNTALVGGVDLSIDPFELVGFSRAGALSKGDMNVYDKSAAGFIPGEGCGFVMLKRLEDARRDGNKVYAVLKGWGVSSDGKGGIMTPTSGGQALAIRRAYTQAGYSPADLDFVEGHGTGTSVGDMTELKGVHEAQTHPDESSNVQPRQTGMTSLKSIVGHTKAAAGIGAFIKATMAVNRRVLPPTGSCTAPNPTFQDPCRSLYPIMQGAVVENDEPLRAGVSAMGFGGINSHVTIESGDAPQEAIAPQISETALLVSNQTSEVFALTSDSFEQLRELVAALRQNAEGMSCAELGDLSADLAAKASNAHAVRAAVVAGQVSDLVQRLEQLDAMITSQTPSRGELKSSPQGNIWLSYGNDRSRVGFLFPGQGSQQISMARKLVARFDWASEMLAVADHVQSAAGLPTVTETVFAHVQQTIDPEQLKAKRSRLAQTENAQVAIVTASAIYARYLEMLGIRPVICGGHSLGELMALHQAGAFGFEEMVQLVSLRGRAMASSKDGSAGAMAALLCSRDKAEELISKTAGYAVVANINSKRQLVISGDVAAVEAIVNDAKSQSISATTLNVSNAFHSKYVQSAADTLRQQGPIPRHPKTLDIKVVSCVDGAVIEQNVDLREHLGHQIVGQVDFVSTVQTIEAQCDLLIEVGPGNVLSRLVPDILQAPGVTCVPSASKPEVDCCLNRLLATAFAHGVDVQWDHLFANRLHRPFIPASEKVFVKNPCENELADLGDVEALDLIDPFSLPDQQSLSSPDSTSFFPSRIDNSIDLPNMNLINEPSVSPVQTAAPDGVEELVLATIEERTGFPKETLTSDLRLLDDLNLDSIKAGDIVATVAREMQIEGEIDPSILGDATIADLVNAIRMVKNGDIPAAESNRGQVIDAAASDAVSPPMPANDSRQASVMPTEPSQSEMISPQAMRDAPMAEVADWVRSFTVDFVDHRPMSEQLDISDRHFHVLYDSSHGYFIELLARRFGERNATASFETYDNPGQVIGDTPPEGSKLYSVAILPRETVADSSREKLSRMVYRLHHAVQTTNPRNPQAVKGITFVEFGNGRFGTEGMTDVERSGAAAFARSLHLESPGLEVRVIDFADELSDFLATDFITNEIATTESYCDAAYDRLGRRFETRHRLLQPNETEARPLELGSGDVVLVTGGAKGITAECALALAEKTGANFALVGSSPHPSQVMGAAAEEIQATLARFEALSGRCEYFACDLTDGMAVRQLVEQVDSTLGRVTSVIHGAGRNHAGAACAASLEQALQEVSPKVLGVTNLLEALSDRPLRCLVGLTSIIGVTGIPGNAWYGFSNETLDLILRHYQNMHPEALVRSISYSAWSDVGMGAKGNVEANLRRMGVGMIPLQEGVQRFMHAMEHSLDNTQMLVTSSLGGIDTWWPIGADKCTRASRFIDAVVSHEPNISLTTRVKLTHQSDPYLKDHVYSGTCLFPAVLGMEAMAQVAAHLMPEQPTVIRIQNVDLPKPIIVGEEGMVELEIHAEAAETNANGETVVSVGIRTERTQFQQDHFAAEIVFGALPMGALQPEQVREPLGIDPQRDLYNGIMFQGPLFQRWGSTYHLERGLMNLDVHHSDETCRGEGVFGQDVPSGSLLTGDVFYRDVLLQSIQALIPQRIGLPLSIEKIEFFAPGNSADTKEMESMGDGEMLPQPQADRRLVLSKMNVIGDKVGEQHICEVIAKDPTGEVREHMVGYRVKVLAINEEYPTAEQLADLAAYDQEHCKRQVQAAAMAAGLKMPAVQLARMPELHGMMKDERHQVECPLLEQTATEFLMSQGRHIASPLIEWKQSGQPLVANEPDCKISLSHDEDYCLCIANEKTAGCDLAPVTPRSREQWEALLGNPNAMLLTDLMAAGDCIDQAGTRIWAAVEAAQKSIDQAVSVPLKIESAQEGTVVFTADCLGDSGLVTTAMKLHRNPVRILAIVAPKAMTNEMATHTETQGMAVSARHASMADTMGQSPVQLSAFAPSQPSLSRGGIGLAPSQTEARVTASSFAPSQSKSAMMPSGGGGNGHHVTNLLAPSKPMEGQERNSGRSQAEMLAMAKMATAAMSPEEAQVADAGEIGGTATLVREPRPMAAASAPTMPPPTMRDDNNGANGRNGSVIQVSTKELAPPDVIRVIDDITAVHKWDGPQDQAVFEYKYPVTFKECAKKGKHVQDSQFIDWMGQLRENALLYLCPEIAHKLSDGLSGMATNWTDIDIVGEIMMGDMVIARFFREEMTEATINLVCEFCKLMPDGRLMRVAFVRQAATWVELEGKKDPTKAAFPKFLADALRKVAPRSSEPPVYGERMNNLGRLKIEQERLEKCTRQAPAVLWTEEFQTTSADSNIVQNLYHSRYFNWQWRTSDLFLYNVVPQLVSSITTLGSVKELIPLNSHIDYVRDAFPFDKIRTELAVTRMTECAATLQFTHSRQLESGEWQKLAVCKQDAVWVRRTHAATPAPEPFPRAVREALMKASRG